MSQNQREMLGAVRTLQTLVPLLPVPPSEGTRLLLQTDNMSVRAYLSKEGGPVPALNDMATRVLLYRSSQLRGAQPTLAVPAPFLRPASRKPCLEGEGLHLFRYPSPLRDRLGQPAAPAVTPFLRSAVLLVVERSYTPTGSCTVAFGQYNRFLFWLLLLLAAKLLRRVGSTAGTYLL